MYRYQTIKIRPMSSPNWIADHAICVHSAHLCRVAMRKGNLTAFCRTNTGASKDWEGTSQQNVSPVTCVLLPWPTRIYCFVVRNTVHLSNWAGDSRVDNRPRWSLHARWTPTRRKRSLVRAPWHYKTAQTHSHTHIRQTSACTPTFTGPPWKKRNFPKRSCPVLQQTPRPKYK